MDRRGRVIGGEEGARRLADEEVEVVCVLKLLIERERRMMISSIRPMKSDRCSKGKGVKR